MQFSPRQGQGTVVLSVDVADAVRGASVEALVESFARRSVPATYALGQAAGSPHFDRVLAGHPANEIALLVPSTWTNGDDRVRVAAELTAQAAAASAAGDVGGDGRLSRSARGPVVEAGRDGGPRRHKPRGRPGLAAMVGRTDSPGGRKRAAFDPLRTVGIPPGRDAASSGQRGAAKDRTGQRKRHDVPGIGRCRGPGGGRPLRSGGSRRPVVGGRRSPRRGDAGRRHPG